MATHPRIPPRRGGTRAGTWWGKAWLRAVEEAAYGEAELKQARSLSRSGQVGGITVDPGRFLAAVEDGDDVVTVSGSVPVLDEDGLAAFAETVAAESGRIGALLHGDLPHPLVEHAEETGLELLPYGGELSTRCSCEPWVDPCHHALAVLYQLTWLLEADPFVLLELRGIERDDLLARLHTASARQGGPGGSEGSGGSASSDEEVARDARQRAQRLLDSLADPDADLAALL